jgi:hypothetical protein
MKKIVYASLFLISFITSNAQKDFQGMAVYESKTSTADFKSRFEGNKEITPEIQKMIEERMKKMFEKTFFLNFDKSASIYKEEEKLDTPGQGQGGGMRMMSSFMGGGGTYYKNVKEKKYTVDKEFMGKEFLIKDSLTTYKWQMSSEARVIGGYVRVTNGETQTAGSALPFSYSFPTEFKFTPIVTATPVNNATASTAGNDVVVTLSSVTTSSIEGSVKFNVGGVSSVGVNLIAIGIPN